MIERRLREQAAACERIGSPLYAALLMAAADDARDGGPTFRVLEGHEEDPPESYPAVRLMGAVHRLVLQGRAPELARHYPSVDGAPGDAWPAFRDVVVEHEDEIRVLLDRPIQTNEVGRSAVVVGAFLTFLERARMPLRVLEIGASAGLNLRWDRYRYESRAWEWGDPGSPVRFEDVFEEGLPPTPPAEVVERRGCDLQPVDPSTDEGRLTLLSFVWADQVHRFERLRAALEVAREVPAPVDRENAASWLERRLETRTPDVATAVFHTVTLGYFDEESRARVEAAVQAAGGAATEDAPFAWLGMEIEEMRFPVRLAMWPWDPEERIVGYSGAHGPPVRWLA